MGNNTGMELAGGGLSCVGPGTVLSPWPLWEYLVISLHIWKNLDLICVGGTEYSGLAPHPALRDYSWWCQD